MSVHLNLIDFLRTGEFGGIHLGTQRSVLIEALGQPDAYHQGRKERLPTIYKYGDFEFYFPAQGDGLCMIFADHFETPQGNQNLIIAPGWLRGVMSLQDVETNLGNDNIAYEEAWGLVNEQIILTTSGGVRLGFVWEEADGCLFSIVYREKMKGATG